MQRREFLQHALLLVGLGTGAWATEPSYIEVQVDAGGGGDNDNGWEWIHIRQDGSYDCQGVKRGKLSSAAMQRIRRAIAANGFDSLKPVYDAGRRDGDRLTLTIKGRSCRLGPPFAFKEDPEGRRFLAIYRTIVKEVPTRSGKGAPALYQ